LTLKGLVYVPQPVLSEIAYGSERLPKSKRRDSLQERFELVLSEIQRIEWTDDVSARFGGIKAVLEKKGCPVLDAPASSVSVGAPAPALRVCPEGRRLWE